MSAPATADRYRWIALSNTTLAVLLATLDASITLIAMPDIFRGIHLDPLVPANSFYLLWMILGYLVGQQALAGLPSHAHAVLTGSRFFPQLISGAFRDGLHTAFTFAIAACLLAAGASLMRGSRYHHADEGAEAHGVAGQIPRLEEQSAG